MRKSGPFSPKFGEIDPQVWGRFFATHHPVKTASCVAARIGLSERTVEKWLDGTGAPNLRAFVRLVSAYGPEFLAVCMPGCGWLSEPAREARRDRLRRDLAQIEGELAMLQDRS